MNDQQAEAHLWLAFVNAESRREHAPPRGLELAWRRRLLRAVRSIGRKP